MYVCVGWGWGGVGWGVLSKQPRYPTPEDALVDLRHPPELRGLPETRISKQFVFISKWDRVLQASGPPHTAVSHRPQVEATVFTCISLHHTVKTFWRALHPGEDPSLTSLTPAHPTATTESTEVYVK